MRVLIIGGGGREHAFAWQVAAGERVTQVFVAPGNAGTALEAKTRNVPIAADDVDGLAAFAERERIDLTIVGPEAPLVLGVVDRFTEKGLRCFGPSQAAARLEGSKAFAKAFLKRHRIPTARSRTFTAKDYDAGYVLNHRTPVVVKASGLAAGKGVVIATTTAEALAAVEEMFSGRFGAAGQEVVVEEFLEGEEASFIVMAGRGKVLPLASSQDHKRRDDGDRGPNTGGMGAYSPAPVVTPAIHARAMREVIEPTLQGLAAEGIEYTGFLYAGLMIAADGTPNVLEFNCRCGDPETQPILSRLRSDLILLCESALDGTLDQAKIDWDRRAAVGVVMAAGGYPDAYQAGDGIEGLEAAARLPGKVFHAGTKLAGNRIVTAGGRVLCAVGLGTSVTEAQRSAYALVECIEWRGAHYRRDIGGQAVEREKWGHS
ncbi:MAG TPA: phosphoribosylamine--glycine ligase [Steroidobacteraceae bacterium]|nr:phosphoribosylamine--glycine ligase [Steroidobacteraceae bacterium]